jgi:hypothetical protein
MGDAVGTRGSEQTSDERPLVEAEEGRPVGSHGIENDERVLQVHLERIHIVW